MCVCVCKNVNKKGKPFFSFEIVFERMNAFCVNSPLQTISINLDKMYSINMELWVKTWKEMCGKTRKDFDYSMRKSDCGCFEVCT